MWNDLNMHDRHKLIRLAVTNGIYDLDTIHSLYDNNEYKDGGNMKIASYKDNASYPDRKLYRNVKRDFRKNPEAEYKDYEEYGIRVYNPSLSSDAPNRKERQEAMLERIRQDFPEIQKNDVKKTAFKSNTLGWHNSNTGFMGNEDKRILYGLQQEYDFVNNIVPYGKLGMDTPENIRRKEELERKNRNTTFDYTNNFAIGGDLPTDPNRLSINTNPIIDRIRAKRLARYTAPDSALAQIKELTDNIRENEFKREFAEWINPTRNTNNYVDIRRIVPVAEAGPTFINTYELGGPENPPYDWTKAWQQEANKQTTTQQTGKYNVVATDGKNSNYNYEKNVTPDLSWYKDPLENTRMVTEEPIEPLYGFKDPVFNIALLGAGLANGATRTLLGDVVNGVKTLSNFKFKVPSEQGRYYRYVGKDAIDDYIETGMLRTSADAGIRQNSGDGKFILRKEFNYNMFGKDRPWQGSLNSTEKNPNKLYVVRSKKDTGPIKWEQSNIDFRHKGHSGIFRPVYEGEFGTSPIEYFEYFEPVLFGDKKIGYIRKDFPTKQFSGQ